MPNKCNALRMDTVRYRILSFALLVCGLATGTAWSVSSSISASYSCEQGWKGPSIGIKGVLVPLPFGYSLVDRSVYPHRFINFYEVTQGEPLGTISIGQAPGFFQARIVDETEFKSRKSKWKGAHRETLTHRETGRVIETFVYDDDVVLEFSGEALGFAEVMASCYSDLLPGTIDMTEPQLPIR